jgi:cell division septation protein DedD
MCIAALSSVLLLAACDENGGFNFTDVFQPKPEAEAPAAPAAAEFIEKDVEAPEVFAVNEAGLWDGRPSLGGVWVAHPDVKDPERVMIRNTSNGKFVVGALFRRELNNPGPRLQLSSDAAVALDVLAGAPVELNVVALRKERIEIAPPEPEVPADAEAEIPTPAEIEETELDPIAIAGAAIEAAPETAPVQSTLPVSTLARPFVQVGIYNVERNANTVADQMRSAGMVPTVKPGENNGKTFWRVVVGPAGTAADQEALLTKIKAEGYTDAYPVTN